MGTEISIGQHYKFVGYTAKFGKCLMVYSIIFLNTKTNLENNSYTEVIIHEQSNRRYKQTVCRKWFIV